MELTEQDELPHTPSAEGLWRESLYLSFHDAGGQVGGMSTIGILPNQGRAQGHAVLFLDAHRVLLLHAESPLAEGETGLCAVAGLRYTMLDPLRRWRVQAAAGFAEVDPYELARGARPSAGTTPVQLDLAFDALSPAYEYPQEVFPLLTGKSRHFEQVGRVEGKVAVGGQPFAVAGFGYRDHSWGLRDLSKTGGIVGICAQLGADLTANAFQATREGRQIALGFVCRQGVNTPVDRVRIAVESDPLSGFPRAAQAEVGTADGQRLSLQAEVRSVMPVLMDHGKERVYWYECSTRFTAGREAGWGTLSVTERVGGEGAS